ncbi:MAG TPA: hypothetical protein VFM82_06155 [Flavobacteriaceae bacterium]|nr:hypothetical protein [Flavobacteriaceae bacterium]
MKRVLKFSIIALLFVACDKDCGDEVAATGPVGFTFEVVKESTHENVFTAGFYTKSQIHITDQNDEPITFDFIAENNLNLIKVNLGWETKTDVYDVTIGEDIEFQILFSLKETETECSSSTHLENLEIQGAESETSEETYMRILVP